jgi:Fe-Mn family superoxide dismutase
MPQYALPSLPYDLRALEPHLSSEILDLHYNKHHAAYVKGANDTLEKLADARQHQELGHIGQLEKSLAFHISGHALHSLLWKNMSPDGGGAPSGAFGAALDRYFGSFDGFKAQLNAAAETVQGSGWGALSWEPLGKRLVVEQVHDHQSNVCNGALPILVIDMWEHAYYLQYQNRKKEWLAAFWEVVNWNDVAARFEKVQRTDIGV